MVNKKEKSRKIVKKNQDVGRPKLQDSQSLTPEMELVCQMAYLGFSREEIAAQIDIPLSKIELYLDETNVVRDRLKELFSDKRKRAISLRMAIFEACARRALRILETKGEEVQFDVLDRWMTRYDPMFAQTDKERQYKQEELQQDGSRQTNENQQLKEIEGEKEKSIFDSIRVEEEIEKNDVESQLAGTTDEKLLRRTRKRMGLEKQLEPDIDTTIKRKNTD